MKFLQQHKYLKAIAIIAMIWWILSSNSESKKVINYVKDGKTVGKDIGYVFSETRKILELKDMSEEELKEYHAKQQKDERTKKNENLKENTKRKVFGFKDFQKKMSENIQKEEKRKQEENATESASEIEEYKIIAIEELVAKKYGKLTPISKRGIKCGDYVKLKYLIYIDGKNTLPENTTMNILVGSGLHKDIENLVNGMKQGEKKSEKVPTQKGQPTLKQTIEIVNIKEVENKDLLKCK